MCKCNGLEAATQFSQRQGSTPRSTRGILFVFFFSIFLPPRENAPLSATQTETRAHTGEKKQEEL
ncbi:hypothetical protein WN55_08392 [Dufourea novaeangliae]|uniref:Uncharacterized protein n=1 Tax=Dufourea novaeangliae TaxID=178035 RepID=A0A154P8Y9_DUFNO|nr:hypothetical protein WN55_08392 [Dufourea novaeangliae]